MTIYQLTLTQKRNYRYELTESSLHISEKVARKFAEEKISKGFEEPIYNEWGNCSKHIDYYEEYKIEKIFVNEG